MPADTVTVGYVHDIEVAYSWHASYVDLIGWDITHDQNVVRGGWIGVRYGTGGITAARNQVVRQFLENNRADWLWWIDTDMGFAPDTVDRLLAAANPDEAPIVGGLCFVNREVGLDGMGGFRTAITPTIYYWGELDGRQGFQAVNGIPENQLLRCDGTGSACILIHRSVFERISLDRGEWYDPLKNPTTGMPLGEDLSFCIRAGAAGVPVHVHTGVLTTHLKPRWVGIEDYSPLEQVA